MKKILLFHIFIFLTLGVFSQSEGISYQAIIIDNDPLEIPGQDLINNYLSYGEVSLRFTIYDAESNTIYQEEQTTTTDEFGLINLIIGEGEQTAGYSAFTEIDWNGNPKDLGVELSYTADNYEELSHQALLYIPYAYHRNITADGILEVNGPTFLNNDLTVDGDAQFNGNTSFNSISVENQSDLQGDVVMGSSAEVDGYFAVNNGSQALFTGPVSVESYLTVEELTTLQNGLNVTNGNTNLSGELDVTGSVHLGNDLTVSQDLSVEGASDFSGQILINAGLAGTNDANYDHYAVRIQGANEGIAIKLNGGRNASKNYLNFMDANGIHGCIEGQTLNELNSSFRFIWDNVMAGLDEGFALAEALACGFNVPPDAAEVVSNGAQAIAAYAQWVELASYATNNVGVNFSSGGADYAEWLERENHDQILQPGQVVGIFAGKISLKTQGAHELKVISTNPIVLGNKPPETEELQYERVAFLGQAPIRVVGKVNEGDYLVPSGSNDGLAKAFSANDLPTHRFNEIIGIAWDTGTSESLNIVNAAIGMNNNDISQRMSELENEVELLKKQVDQILIALNNDSIVPTENLISAEYDSHFQTKSRELSSTETSSLMTDEEFENWLQKTGPVLEEVMGRKKEYLESIGSDYSIYPEAKAMLENPVQALKDIRSGAYMASLWENIEKRIKP